MKNTKSDPAQQHKWLILSAMISMTFITAMDLSALNIALPTIGRALHTTLSQLQWIMNIFAITTAMFIALGGKLADIFGHRKLFVIGVTTFGIASLSCGLATNEYTLICSRALQGIGSALAMPAIVAIAFSVFEEERKGLAISFITVTSGVTQSIGPTLGGLIVKFLSWNWIFFINLPVVIFSITLTLLFCPKYVLPKNIDKTNNQKINYKNSTLLALSLFLIIFTFNEVQNWGIKSALFLLCFTGSIILFTLFAYLDKRSSRPLIDAKLLANKIFMLVTGLRCFISFNFYVALFILGLCLQNMLMFDPLKTGMLILFMTVAQASVAPITGKLVDKIGGRRPIMIAILLFASAFSLLMFVTPTTSPTFLMFPLLLIGLGFGNIGPASNTVAMAAVDAELRGTASGIYNTLNYIGGACGTAITGTLISLSSSHYLQKALIAHHLTVPANKLALLKQAADGSLPIHLIENNLDAQLATKVIPLVQHAYFHAFRYMLLLCVTLALLAFIATYLTKPQKYCSKY